MIVTIKSVNILTRMKIGGHLKNVEAEVQSLFHIARVILVFIVMNTHILIRYPLLLSQISPIFLLIFMQERN